MYYQDYEDYMRNILGYPMERVNTYEAYPYTMASFENAQNYSNTPRYNNEIMNLYPEIYKIVNPMVCKICDTNTKPITRELVDQMTNEVYMNLETQPEMDAIVNVRVNTATSKPKVENKRNTLNTSMDSNKQNSSMPANRTAKENEDKELKETRDIVRENGQRRPNNRILQDLIRILILNRLLGQDFLNRPHFSTRPPMRPPFPREDRIYEQYF